LTAARLRHAYKHALEENVSSKVLLKAILQTLNRPENIKVQPGNHTLLYSGPEALTVSSDGSDEATIIKRLAFYVSIDQRTGNLATAFFSSDKKNVRTAWDGTPWISRNADTMHNNVYGQP
jgi:hypothetical protein